MITASPASLAALRRIAAIAGWLAAAIVVAATLSPIEARPHIADMGANAERFLAYFVTTAALVVAYPKRVPSILLGVFLLVVGLEVAQAFEETRHARTADALVKIAGAVTGLLAVASLRRLWTALS